MKFLLIALNVLLAAALVHLAWISAADPVAFPSKTKPVPQSAVDGNKTSAVRVRTRKATSVFESPEVTEKRIEALEKRNVFNTERVPDAPANKTAARATQQVRADMSLVGTYTIGDALGAIILQRLQGNAQQQLKALQQKEYEQYQASATRITDPKKKAEAAAERAAAADDAEAGVAEVLDEEGRKVVVMGNPTISANNVFRQHLKVGDTTVTGYKLVEVTRTSAVLTKNNERIELTLLSPSEAGNIARQRQQNNNNNNRNNQNNNNNARNNNNNNNRNNNNARNNNNNNNRNNQNNNSNARNNNNNNNRNNNNARNNNNNRNNNRDEFELFSF